MNKRRYAKYLVAAVSIIGVGFLARNLLALGDNSSSQTTKTILKAATANVEIQKDYQVSVLNEDGEEVDGVLMRLENAEVRDEIIVQGQKANSVAGRAFLVINMKLVNELEQAVEINTKDYLRLGISEAEWFAPDIHNDPVLVQAISTKPTRVAFPVDGGLRKFSLKVGEISGEKETVEIDFSK